MNILKRLFKNSYVRKGFSEAYSEVKQGRMLLALKKIDALHFEFPSLGSIVNEKGNIHSKYLGCGKHAYELYCEAVTIDDSCTNALINATDYSPTEDDFRRWSAVSLKRVGAVQFTARIRQILSHLDSGTPYGVFLAANTQKHIGLKKFGLSASFAELWLDLGGFPQSDELRVRRTRSQCLRELDIAAESNYRYRDEVFPPNERLALLEAVRELDKAIEIDEYDPELWNLKAAWSVLLRDFEEVIRCADKSLENASGDYIKPLVNKEIALTALERRNEAHLCLEEALGRVNGDADHPDIVLMKMNMRAKHQSPST